MREIKLNGSWTCTFPDGRTIDVQVPDCWENYVDEKNIGEKVVYARSFYIEKQAQTKQRLTFEHVSYYCDVYVNEELAGSHEGMWDSFSIDITNMAVTGENQLRLDIWKPGYKDNDRFLVRQVLSGFIPDVLHTFGGIWGDVKLQESSSFFIDDHRASGNMQGEGTLHLKISGSDSFASCIISGQILDADNNAVADLKKTSYIPDQYGMISIPFSIEQPHLWQINQPYLYSYELTLASGGEQEKITGRLGFREIRYDKTQILLNDRPLYLRGLLHWGYYDEVIPRPPEEVISNEIEQLKEYGFNMIKHCLYMPSRSYLDLADEKGILLWVELPLWLPDLTDELEPRIKREYPRLLEQIAGHPSVVVESLGCELDDKVRPEILEEMYNLAKKTNNVLVRDNSGSGECYDGPTIDFADFSDYHFYGDLQNMENLMETFTPGWRQNRPWLFGEFCDSDTMRDMDVLRKEVKVEKFSWELDDPERNPVSQLKPDFFLHDHDARMMQSGIRENFKQIRDLSYDHAMVHRKTTIEQTRSFPEISGYNITSIRDVPIATSGIFDDLAQEKFNSAAFKSFNQDIVLSPAWDLTRIWLNADRVLSKERYNFWSGATYNLHILASNYSAIPLNEVNLHWKITDITGMSINSGSEKAENITPGAVSRSAYISAVLPQVEQPATYILKVDLIAGRETVSSNEWPIFVYPKTQMGKDIGIGIYDPANIFSKIETRGNHISELSGDEHVIKNDIVLASHINKHILDYVYVGGNVIYVQRGKGAWPSAPVAFWREGMVQYEADSLLGSFNREYWQDDLRFFGVATDTAFQTGSQEFEQFDQVRSLIRRYDCREWRRDEYALEIKYGRGRIIATTLRLEGGMGKQPMFVDNNTMGAFLLDTWIAQLTGNVQK